MHQAAFDEDLAWYAMTCNLLLFLRRRLPREEAGKNQPEAISLAAAMFQLGEMQRAGRNRRRT